MWFVWYVWLVVTICWSRRCCLQGATADEIVVNPHDRFKCKLSWDLPVEYTNVTARGDVHGNFEYGQYNWEGIRYDNEPVPAYNPFIPKNDPLPQAHQDLILDCASGMAMERAACAGPLRPACDSFCEYTCLTRCASSGKARDLVRCLVLNGMDGCVFNVQHTHWLKARACRKEFTSILFQYPRVNQMADTSSTEALEPRATATATETPEPTPELTPEPPGDTSVAERTEAVQGSTGVIPLSGTSSMTVYIVEVAGENVREINWKRVNKATLSMALETEFVLDSIAPDFGNLVDPISGVDIQTCDLGIEHVLHSPLDRPDTLIHTPHLGASYVVRSRASDGVVVDSHITPMMSASALHGTGSFPKQLMVWWPGIQPMFAGGSGNIKNEEIFLKVTMQGYPSHFLSTQGFIVLTSGIPLHANVLILYIFLFSLFSWLWF